MKKMLGLGMPYVVWVGRRGPEAFGWEIRRQADEVVVHCSTQAFRTRIEAIIDSARAAAELRIEVEPTAIEGDSDEGE